LTSHQKSAVVLDTMVVSAILNATRKPEPAAEYSRLIARRRIVLSFATITELRYGALKANWSELRRRSLERSVAHFSIVQADDALMSTCARLRASCETDGHPLGQKLHEADRWIAATAIHLNLELVSDDRVFTSVNGLTVRSRSH